MIYTVGGEGPKPLSLSKIPTSGNNAPHPATVLAGLSAPNFRELKDNLYHGKGKYYVVGKLMYEDDFVDGKGIAYHANGAKSYEGMFVNDRASGQGRLYNKDGSMKYKGTFENGKAVSP